MTTKTDICNIALSHIGQRSILNVDDTTESSENRRKCYIYYPIALKSTLEAHTWNFAKKTMKLAVYSDKSDVAAVETVPDWNYLYTYPANCISLRKIYADTGTMANEGDRYEEFLTVLNQRVIASDTADAYLDFTFYAQDESIYSALFIEALSYKLASMIAFPLTGNESLGSKVLGIYQSIIDSARLSNKTQGKVQQEEDSIFVKARG